MSGRATGEAVAIDRDLTLRDGGVLVTYSLSVPGDDPATADVVDDLPSHCEQVQEIGVHPEFEPAEAEVDEERIVFRDTVDDEGLVVRYGISTADPIDEGTLADWAEASPPLVEVVEGETDGPLTRGGGALAKSADVFANAKDSLLGSDDDPEAADGGGEGTEQADEGASTDADDGDARELDDEEALDLESGDETILEDLTDDEASADEPPDFVGEVSDGTDDFAADAMSGPGGDGARDSDEPFGDADGLSAVTDELDDESTAAIRIDRFRSRLSALAGSSLALHAAEDGAVAEAYLSGMAEELEAAEAEFEALREAFGDGDG